MAPTVEKKISELEMGLLHLQQNIDIPEITLPIHPIVMSIIKKCQEENRKTKVEDFGDKVEDPQFLNALQSGVNRWIREIQKVNCKPMGKINQQTGILYFKIYLKTNDFNEIIHLFSIKVSFKHISHAIMIV